jgi:hypothetical protein
VCVNVNVAHRRRELSTVHGRQLNGKLQLSMMSAMIMVSKHCLVVGASFLGGAQPMTKRPDEKATTVESEPLVMMRFNGGQQGEVMNDT